MMLSLPFRPLDDCRYEECMESMNAKLDYMLAWMKVMDQTGEDFTAQWQVISQQYEMQTQERDKHWKLKKEAIWKFYNQTEELQQLDLILIHVRRLFGCSFEGIKDEILIDIRHLFDEDLDVVATKLESVNMVGLNLKNKLEKNDALQVFDTMPARIWCYESKKLVLWEQEIEVFSTTIQFRSNLGIQISIFYFDLDLRYHGLAMWRTGIGTNIGCQLGISDLKKKWEVDDTLKVFDKSPTRNADIHKNMRWGYNWSLDSFGVKINNGKKELIDSNSKIHEDYVERPCLSCFPCCKYDNVEGILEGHMNHEIYWHEVSSQKLNNRGISYNTIFSHALIDSTLEIVWWSHVQELREMETTLSKDQQGMGTQQREVDEKPFLVHDSLVVQATEKSLNEFQRGLEEAKKFISSGNQLIHNPENNTFASDSNQEQSQLNDQLENLTEVVVVFYSMFGEPVSGRPRYQQIHDSGTLKSKGLRGSKSIQFKNPVEKQGIDSSKFVRNPYLNMPNFELISYEVQKCASLLGSTSSILVQPIYWYEWDVDMGDKSLHWDVNSCVLNGTKVYCGKIAYKLYENCYGMRFKTLKHEEESNANWSGTNVEFEAIGIGKWPTGIGTCYWSWMACWGLKMLSAIFCEYGLHGLELVYVQPQESWGCYNGVRLGFVVELRIPVSNSNSKMVLKMGENMVIVEIHDTTRALLNHFAFLARFAQSSSKHYLTVGCNNSYYSLVRSKGQNKVSSHSQWDPGIDWIAGLQDWIFKRLEAANTRSEKEAREEAKIDVSANSRIEFGIKQHLVGRQRRIWIVAWCFLLRLAPPCFEYQPWDPDIQCYELTTLRTRLISTGWQWNDHKWPIRNQAHISLKPKSLKPSPIGHIS